MLSSLVAVVFILMAGTVPTVDSFHHYLNTFVLTQVITHEPEQGMAKHAVVPKNALSTRV